jgi:hypothetical protein
MVKVFDKEHELLEEMMRLLEKMGFDSLSLPVPDALEDEHVLESALIYVRILNARFDKHEATQHIKTLMEKYNIRPEDLQENRPLGFMHERTSLA